MYYIHYSTEIFTRSNGFLFLGWRNIWRLTFTQIKKKKGKKRKEVKNFDGIWKVWPGPKTKFHSVGAFRSVRWHFADIYFQGRWKTLFCSVSFSYILSLAKRTSRFLSTSLYIHIYIYTVPSLPTFSQWKFIFIPLFFTMTLCYFDRGNFLTSLITLFDGLPL